MIHLLKSGKAILQTYLSFFVVTLILECENTYAVQGFAELYYEKLEQDGKV